LPEHISQINHTPKAVTAAADTILSVHEAVLDLDKEPLNTLPIRRKLTIGSTDDPLEHEADAVADKIMRMPEHNFIQRKCTNCDEEEKVLMKPLSSFIQKMGSDTGTKANDNVTGKINSTRGSGSGLDSSTKSFMESRFGTDFSGVKIHTGDYAVQLSQELNAQAFTVGNDVYFNSGKYDPDSNSGKHLLAHELTHTIQQNLTVQPKMLQRAVYVCDEYRTVSITTYNPGPGINLSLSGHAISISANLEVYGNGATLARANQIKATIERIWNASFSDGYSVTTTVNIQVRGASEDSGRTQINIILGGGMDVTSPRYWIAGSNYISYYTDSDINWVPAHEFGHLLGLDDRYSEGFFSKLGGLLFNSTRTNTVNPGWEGNLMAVSGGVLEKKNLEDLIRIGFSPRTECARGHLESPL